jgi:hypothetical protein
MLCVVIDPSGSFNEGKGHTGIAYIKDNDWTKVGTLSVSAKDYQSRHDYWEAVMRAAFKDSLDNADVTPEELTVVIESFVIRTNGFTLGKMPETIQFIGAMVWELENLGVSKIVFQTPSQAKTRFADTQLPDYIPNLVKEENGFYYLNGKRINDHVRDALKHLLFFKRYGEYKI